jgi:hypothetical protein
VCSLKVVSIMSKRLVGVFRKNLSLSTSTFYLNVVTNPPLYLSTSIVRSLSRAVAFILT